MDRNKFNLHFQKQQSLPREKYRKLKSQNEEELEQLIDTSKRQPKIFYLKEFFLKHQNLKYFTLRMHLKGKDEQKQYEQNPKLMYLLRRGLTVLLIDSCYVTLRKGLPKFYELDDFWQNQGQVCCNYERRESFLYQNQLFRAFQSLNLNLPITIVEQQQENGENCQISYSKILETWVISSKNVTMFFKDEQSFFLMNFNRDQESPQRLPCQIAEIWFQQIKNENIENLKRDLTNKTLVGEFVNNPFFNHIIEYKEQKLIFFALINNDDPNFCCQTLDAEFLTHKYNLNFVKTKYTQINDQFIFQNHLKMIQEQIKQSSIERRGEGVVVYIFNQFECLSIFKIKTTDYEQHRLFRTKLQELIVNWLQISNSFIDAYYQQANDLNIFDDREMKKTIEFNCQLLTKILKYIQTQKRNDLQFQDQLGKQVQKNYIQFYSKIAQFSEYFEKDNFDHKVFFEQLEQWNTQVCNQQTFKMQYEKYY